jgi:hypothetical protein
MTLERTSVVWDFPIFPVPGDADNEKGKSSYQQYHPDDGFSRSQDDRNDTTDKHECPDGNPVDIS